MEGNDRSGQQCDQVPLAWDPRRLKSALAHRIFLKTQYYTKYRQFTIMAYLLESLSNIFEVSCRNGL